jgi:glycosyltransferase involved in cell wall biosynthesis
MPILKHRASFEIARRLKAFLRLHVGLTRGEVPDTEQQVEAQAEQLRQARDQIKRQTEQLKELRERLSSRNEQVAMLQQTRDQQSAGLQAKNQQIIRKDKHIARLQAKLEVVGAGALATARKMPLVGELERKLAILDDAFPHLLSAFRIAEYNAYLEEWKDAVVFSTASSFPLLHEARSFKEVLDEYASRYPQFKGRIRSFDGESDLEDSLVYTMFLNNANFFLDTIHAYNVPFVFTLYPGGGLELEQDESDEKLRRVCSSPNLQKVIATQKVVHEYLLKKKLCDPQKIEFVYGGVYPSSLLSRHAADKSLYKEDKDTFDVCFVAHKYMERGADKGYDVFVEVARLLSEAHEDAFFHVVGSFDETDVDTGGLEGRISFYGTRPTEFFPSFYSRMDAIVSPNAPFMLAPGSFDIFPLGTCIEAGSCGVAVFCTDPLEQNVAFEDGEEIVIVPRDAQAISETVSWYHDHPEALRELSGRGREAFRRVFDMEAQMEPRLRILSELMGREPSASEANSSNDRQDGDRKGTSSA